jgi:hypothetical protein
MKTKKMQKIIPTGSTRVGASLAAIFTILIITSSTQALWSPNMDPVAVVAQLVVFFPHEGDILNVGTYDEGKVIYVKADAVGANDGTNWAKAYNDLQDALAVAVTGGTETDLSQRGPTTNETVLSGDLNGDDDLILNPLYLVGEPTRSDNSFHVVTGSGTDETAVLDGFIITGGYADGLRNLDGGGIINIWKPGGGRTSIEPIPANPTISNCIFIGNFAERNGGAIYNEGAHPTLRNCKFTSNFSNAPGNFSQGGGGMFNINGNPLLVDCVFVDNMAADDGAGMTNEKSSPFLINCIFRRNVVGSGPNIGVGGGMYNNNDSAPILVNCIFSENEADLNGTGGGIFNQDGSHSILINCTFIGNSAGPSVGSWANGGGGLFNQDGSRPIVTNCIFWGNRDKNGTGRSAQIAGSSYGVNATTVTYSCVQGSWSSGIGNISLDPLFVNAEGPDGIAGTDDDDLRLSPESPCIDAGDNIALPFDIADLDDDGVMDEPIPFDLDWDSRIVGTGVDMGAYEFETAPVTGGD